MTETNFDRHLAKHLKDPEFAELYRKADAAWDIALQLSKLRQDAGLSQAQLARKLETSQQQISRLESANYEGHSLSMLRRVAEALNARVVVTFEPADDLVQVNEAPSQFNAKRKRRATPRKAAAKKSARKSATPRKTRQKNHR